MGGDNDCKRWVWVEKMLGSIPKTCLLDYRPTEGLEKTHLNAKTTTVGSCNVDENEHMKPMVKKPNPTSRPKPRSTSKPKRKTTKGKTSVKPSTQSIAEMTESTTRMSTAQADTAHTTTKNTSSGKRTTKKPMKRRTTPRKTTSRRTTRRNTTTNSTTVAIDKTTTTTTSTTTASPSTTTPRATQKATTRRRQFVTKGPFKKHALSEEAAVVLLEENTSWE